MRLLCYVESEATYILEVDNGIGDHVCNNASENAFLPNPKARVAAPEARDRLCQCAIQTRRGVVEEEALTLVAGMVGGGGLGLGCGSLWWHVERELVGDEFGRRKICVDDTKSIDDRREDSFFLQSGGGGWW